MRNPDWKGILWIVLLWLAAVGIFLFGVLARAQALPKPDHSHKSGAGQIAIQGTVQQVLRHACPRALLASRTEKTDSIRCTTTEVVLATGNGLVNVLLGPTKFIRANQFFFVDGDRLRVIGFQAANQGRATVVSEEVIKSKRALTFRDPHGRPVWSNGAITDVVPSAGIAVMRQQSFGENRTRQLSPPTGKAIATDLRFQNSEKEN